jgi:SNF2 family DNA or RNA helicase
MMPSTTSNFTPHDYQLKAIRLLVSQGAAGLFLDPGLGKTVSVLSAFMILHKKKLAQKMLVVAPLRVASKTWPDEIRKWAHTEHLSFQLLHGPDKEERLREEADIYIINPEGLKWLFERKSHPQSFDTLCLDESSKFKDTQTQRFKLLKPLLPKFARRWILTGTPAPNGIADLFGQIFVLDGGATLGKYITHFRLKYFYQKPGDIYGWYPRPNAHLEIVEKIKPLVLQLSAEDYLKMPEIQYKNIPVELPKAARKTYQEIEEHFISELGDSKVIAANAAVAGGKCRQVANGALYVQSPIWAPVHDAKLDALEDLLEELGGAPTLILYEFKHDAERILGRLGDVPVLGGNLSERALSQMVDKFNRGEIPYLLGHPASMGHGLNLQGSCHHIVWFGITWNLEHYDQAIARVYRQGQKSQVVFVYHLVAVDTLDEKVLKVLNGKDRTQQALLSALGKEEK